MLNYLGSSLPSRSGNFDISLWTQDFTHEDGAGSGSDCDSDSVSDSDSDSDSVSDCMSDSEHVVGCKECNFRFSLD